MNIYEKLNQARCKIQNLNIKPTGKNDYSGYSYFDLSDILPHINSICAELKMTCLLSFGTECATLDIINAEKTDERITFLSPMSKASLKGCHDVQNLGAVITYLTRYLYIMAFSIVEHEVLDKKHNPYDDNKSESNSNNKQIQKMVYTINQALEQGVISDEKQISEAEGYIDRADIKGLTMVYNYLMGGKK